MVSGHDNNHLISRMEYPADIFGISCCASSSNFFIRSLQMSDAFYNSSFFLNYSTLLYGEKMQ